MRRMLWLALIVCGLLAGMAATRWLTLPPSVRAENAAGQFDAVRAKARLARVLDDEAPHPADSAASDGVRERLVAEIRALGLTPIVNDRFACNNLHKANGVTCARVRNVTVTIGKPASAPNLLINTHYDSVPVGPGASDAGLGVAAMLEALSLMKDGPLAREVNFLFNEGEELGLIGARAFLDGDPLSRRVDALINLEARGTIGPVNMFETSVPNGAAVRLFKDSVTHPVANSLAVSAYRLIPNYTDVNTFVEERDWLFLNFAPIGNETRYHSPGDNLAAIDRATLQHMGDQLMEVGTALGSAATPRDRSSGWLGESLFMNIGTRWLFTIELGIALALLMGTALGWLVRRRMAERRSSLRSVLSATLPLLAALLVPVGLAWAGLTAVGSAREGQFWRAAPQASELAIYAGVIAAGLAAIAAPRRWTLPELRRGWWLLFLLLGLLFSLAAPGALVYFLLPPLVFGIGVNLQSRWRHAEVSGALLAALLLFLTLGAMLGLLQDLLNSGPLWIFALFGGLVLMPWLIEARPLLEGWRWSRVAPVALALAALAWVPAALAPAYSVDRQQQWTTQYVLETGKEPRWSIVNDRKALPETLEALGEWRQGRLPIGRRQRWFAPAPAQPGFDAATLTPVATVAMVKQPVGGGQGTQATRSVRLRLRTNGADQVSITADKPGVIRGGGYTEPTALFDPGNPGPVSITCTGRSCDGATLTLHVGLEPAIVQLTATHWRLPAAAAPLLRARPANARPQYLPDATILVSRLRL